MVKYNEMIQENPIELVVEQAAYDKENKLYEVTTTHNGKMFKLVVEAEKVKFSDTVDNNGKLTGKTLKYDFNIYDEDEDEDDERTEVYTNQAPLFVESVTLPSAESYPFVTTSVANKPNLQVDNLVLLKVDYFEPLQANHVVIALQSLNSHNYTQIIAFGEYMGGGVEYQAELRGIHTTLESVLKEYERYDYSAEGFSETF